MTVPDFQSVMLPMLRSCADGRERSLARAREELAREFGLTQEDQDELLPSGRQGLWANRVAWANTYLRQAGLLESTRRGHFRITARGLEVLGNPPDRIDIKFLERFAEFRDFRSRRGKKQETENGRDDADQQETPDETLEDAYQKLRISLAEELLEKIRNASPEFFEHVVVEVLLRMGYGGSRKNAGRALGRSGDEGIDGTIHEDRLGLDVIYLQAKRWQGTVGRPEIQKFVGALHGKRARKGVFMTTGSFSQEARDYVTHIDPRIVLIEGEELAELMIDHGVGVTTVTSYEVKRLDSDYFDAD